ncbi:MAG: GNAT family N-acetyltransferase [Oscillospiraceae bacterium]|jgi:GNAT superfamily N-acetyltransferase|nr:GNAT family N-acetyltransferase [Oscillospiraceae bacterium]
MEITYTGTIAVEQYNALRTAVGWDALHPDLARNGLAHTAFLVVAVCDGAPVGMARVITDYGYYVFISEVIIKPEFQGNGIGRAIMERVMAYINENIAPGQAKFVNLMAAMGKEGFYRKFGFTARPNDTHGPGMSQWIGK